MQRILCTNILSLNFVAYPNIVQEFDGSMGFICVCVLLLLLLLLLLCVRRCACMRVDVWARVCSFLNWGLKWASHQRNCIWKQNSQCIVIHRRGADKSLAQPGRKQATATKLGIYSTYSPQSSIHFLARCSNFCKLLKKNSEGCPSNQVSAAAMTSASD
jgi:hypothetical protein